MVPLSRSSGSDGLSLGAQAPTQHFTAVRGSTRDIIDPILDMHPFQLTCHLYGCLLWPLYFFITDFFASLITISICVLIW